MAKSSLDPNPAKDDIVSAMRAKYDASPASTKNNSLDQLQIEAGALGKFFGNERWAPTSIAGVCAFLLLLIFAFALFFKTGTDLAEACKYILPLLSGIMGFLFGKSQPPGRR